MKKEEIDQVKKQVGVSKNMAVMASIGILLLTGTLLFSILNTYKWGQIGGNSALDHLSDGDTAAGVFNALAIGAFFGGVIAILTTLSRRLAFYALLSIFFIYLALVIYYGIIYRFGAYIAAMKLLFIVVPTGILLYFWWKNGWHREPVNKSVAWIFVVTGSLVGSLLLLITVLTIFREFEIDI